MTRIVEMSTLHVAYDPYKTWWEQICCLQTRYLPKFYPSEWVELSWTPTCCITRRFMRLPKAGVVGKTHFDFWHFFAPWALCCLGFPFEMECHVVEDEWWRMWALTCWGHRRRGTESINGVTVSQKRRADVIAMRARGIIQREPTMQAVAALLTHLYVF